MSILFWRPSFKNVVLKSRLVNDKSPEATIAKYICTVVIVSNEAKDFSKPTFWVFGVPQKASFASNFINLYSSTKVSFLRRETHRLHAYILKDVTALETWDPGTTDYFLATVKLIRFVSNDIHSKAVALSLSGQIESQQFIEKSST